LLRSAAIPRFSAKISGFISYVILGDGKMDAEVDFSQGKRGAIAPTPRGKIRITIRLKDDGLASSE